MSRTLKDIGVCLAIIAASAVVYWDSLSLRVRTYDPLGSGTMPRMVVVGIVILSLVAIAQSLVGHFAGPRPQAVADKQEDFQRRPWLAVLIFCFLIICSVMFYARLPFGITSSLFLFVSILSIKNGEKAIILPAAICSLIFGFGLTYLFGGLFGVDLP